MTTKIKRPVPKKKPVSKGLTDRGTSKARKKKPGILAKAGNSIAATIAGAGSAGGYGSAPDPTTAPPDVPSSNPTAPEPDTSTDTGTSAPDPFKGTPYEGMNAYQIAQKIVNDEIEARKQAILQAQQAQAGINQGQLNTIAGFNQALQKMVAGAGPAYDQTLANLGNSYAGFSKGFQDTYNSFMSQDGSVPGPGGAQYSNPGAGGAEMLAQNAALGQGPIDALRMSNPLNVLPGAYGRLGQMDLTQLAASQSRDMASNFGQELASLNNTQESDTFKMFQDIQAIFDSAGSAQEAAAAQAQADAQKASADGQKYAQWLSNQTGQLYIYDPNTGTVKAARDSKTGAPVYLPGSSGYRNAKAAAAADAKAAAARAAQLAKIKYQQKQIAEKIRHDIAVENNAHASLVEKRQARADRLAQQAIANKLEAQRVAIAQQIADAQAKGVNKPSGGGKKGGLTQGQRNTLAQKRASLISDMNSKIDYWNNTDNPSTPIDKAGARARLWKLFEPRLVVIARQMLAAGMFDPKYHPRDLVEYWINQAISGYNG